MLRRHCSDEELLKRLDGELGAWEALRVSRHLKRCWKCRAALAAIDAQVNELAHILEQEQFPREIVDAARERFFRSAGQLQLRFRDAAPAQFSLRAWPARAAAGLILSFSAFACWHYVRVFQTVAAPAAPVVPKQAVIAAVAPVRPIPALPRRIPPVTLAWPPAPEIGPDLDAIEMRALYILHQRRACLGEEIEIVRSGVHDLSIRGVVASRDRKREIEAALAGLAIPGAVQMELRSADEVSAFDLAALPQKNEDVSADAAPPEIPMRAALMEYLQDEDRAVAVSNQALRLASLAFSHAWALRHLAERYPRERFELLRPEETAMARELIRDHLSALAAASANFSALVRTPLGAAAGTALREASPQAGAASWQAAVESLFRGMERLYAHSNDLFACGDQPVTDLPARAADLRSILDGMAMEISSVSAMAPAMPAAERAAQAHSGN